MPGIWCTARGIGCTADHRRGCVQNGDRRLRSFAAHDLREDSCRPSAAARKLIRGGVLDCESRSLDNAKQFDRSVICFELFGHVLKHIVHAREQFRPAGQVLEGSDVQFLGRADRLIHSIASQLF